MIPQRKAATHLIGVFSSLLFFSDFFISLPRSVAAAATQGVPRASVHTVQGPKKKKRKPGRRKAYAIFCGIETGVCLTWCTTTLFFCLSLIIGPREEADPLVSGVPNCLFRGYDSVEEAHAAYAYAHARSWTRIAGAPVSAIPALPQPMSLAPSAANNPLNGTEDLDDTWFIVYRGISPGVYRSQLSRETS
jgi:hypothetical protein